MKKISVFSHKLRIVSGSIKRVFYNKNYILLFFLSFILSAGIILYVPILTIPGNTLTLQFAVFEPYHYLLWLVLAILISLTISMNIYSIKLKKSMKHLGTGALSGISGFFAGIVATATCPSCLVALLGIFGLGIGSTLFLLKYQVYVALISLLFLAVSIYFISLKMEENCKICEKS